MADSAFVPQGSGLGEGLAAHPPVLSDGAYENEALRANGGFLKMLGVMWKFFFAKPRNTRPSGVIPVRAITRAGLLAAPDRTIYRLGHSSLLLKLRGEFFLTDPVFSERASPFGFAGPKRFHAPPIGIEDLPPVKAVILSHDHYDHLDKKAILRLAERVEHFVTPLGVGDLLIEWGVDAAKIRQLDWWHATEVDGVRLVATPTQHFSGRSMLNRNRTLWCSWVILDGDLRVFYGADSGYFEGFKEIGERFGPFDLTLLENGAYNENWPAIHMQPEETLRAHLDLRGRRLLPIHNGTFDLAMHPWWEPFERIVALAGRNQVVLSTPRMGEAVSLEAAGAGEAWWRGVDGVV